MKNPTIKVDNRESATLTAELIYLGYQVENVLLKAGDFEGETRLTRKLPCLKYRHQTVGTLVEVNDSLSQLTIEPLNFH